MLRPPAASLALIAALLCLAAPRAVGAATWYADPVNGSPDGDGSADAPWPGFDWIVANNKIESMKPAAYPYSEGDPLSVRNDGAPVQPGDTILMRTGDHGDVWIVGYFNPDWVTLRAEEGHTPVLQRLLIRGGCRWRIDGVTFSKEPYATPNAETLMYFNSHGWHGPVTDCAIENCHLYSADDSSAWTVDDWQAKAAGAGISASGQRITIRNCTLRNIKMGILAGTDCLIEHNTLTGIGHDGFRSGGDHIVWQYNRMSDFVDIDGNHDDMIQLYRGGGVPHVDVVIRANLFDGRKIDGRPHTTSPQGVGCFDGPYVNCIVENNIVLTAHYHGITLNDAEGCTIINNTVLDPSRNFPAWIATPNEVGGSSDNVIRNNLGYSIPGNDPARGIVSDHNIQLTDALSDQVFVDWRNGDVHLKAGGPAIDAGSAELAPAEDIDRAARPKGDGVDIGAYEYRDPGDPSGAWSIVAMHGGTEIVTAAGEDTIEPRAAGIRKLRVVIDEALDAATVGVGVVSITGEAGGDQSSLVESVSLEGDRTLVIVLSAALPNADWYTVALGEELRLQNGSPVPGDCDIRLGALVGDVDRSGAVTQADVVAGRALTDQPLGPDTAHADIDGSGAVAGSDLLVVSRHVGEQLPQ